MPDINNDPQNREKLFWDLATPMLINGEAEEGTLMGFKCLRVQGNFFASLERENKGLIVKLPREQVQSLIDSGLGKPFAPNGRVFKEWVLLPIADREVWQAILNEAREFVMR